MFILTAHLSWEQPHFKGSKHKWQVATVLGSTGLEVVGVSESREGTENRENGTGLERMGLQDLSILPFSSPCGKVDPEWLTTHTPAGHYLEPRGRWKGKDGTWMRPEEAPGWPLERSPRGRESRRTLSLYCVEWLIPPISTPWVNKQPKRLGTKSWRSHTHIYTPQVQGQ